VKLPGRKREEIRKKESDIQDAKGGSDANDPTSSIVPIHQVVCLSTNNYDNLDGVIDLDVVFKTLGLSV
jgi:hypothetical protein